MSVFESNEFEQVLMGTLIGTTAGEPKDRRVQSTTAGEPKDRRIQSNGALNGCLPWQTQVNLGKIFAETQPAPNPDWWNKFKYNETKMLEEGLEYIRSTYSQHYVNPEDNVQVLDILNSSDCAADFCRGSAIKYLCRYGKKGGYNRADLLKAFHFVVLLMNFTNKTEK